MLDDQELRRPEGNNLTLVGLIDPSDSAAIVDPNRYGKKVDFAFQAGAGARLFDRHPAMENSRSTGGYAPLYAVTPDWHAIIDGVLPGSGFFVCSGFSGHGFKLAPTVGSIVPIWCARSRPPSSSRGCSDLIASSEERWWRGKYRYNIVG